nr:helix-turn-helix transcriptional regulator [Micromonospora sp. DSM 115978]
MGISPLEYLIRELRRRRVAAGLSQKQLAEKCFCSDTHVSGVETGSRPVTLKYLTLVDSALELGNYFQTMWEEMVRDGDAPVWLRKWIEYERQATALRWYEHAFVPGLLQTEAYARAVFTASQLTPAEVDKKVAERIARQDVLVRESAPPQLFAVIDQLVLHRVCGGPEVMAEQVEHLMTCAEQPNIQLLIVPQERGIYSGLAGSFILADLPDASRAGYVDNQLEAHIVLQPDAVAKLGVSWDNVRSEALPRSSTLELLKEAAKTWA